MKALTLFLLFLIFLGCDSRVPNMSEEEIQDAASVSGGQSAKYSPDGIWVLYQVNDDVRKRLKRIKSDGTDDQELYTFRGYLCCANYSRDAQYITFNTGNPDLDIWKMNADGSNAQVLDDNNLHEGGPSWTYDNKKLVYTSVHEGKFELAGIYTSNPDGTDRKRLHSLDFRAFDPAWSHDNKTVLAQHVENNNNNNIYAIDVQTGSYLQLTDSDSADWYPSWSPNDQTIAYRNNDSGNWSIILMNRDGSNKRTVTTEATEDRLPSFSPDGKYIIYQSKAKGDLGFDIWRMDADGSDPVNLTNDSFDNQGPSWSPDSKYILYSAKVNGVSQVMRIGVKGDAKEILTRKSN